MTKELKYDWAERIQAQHEAKRKAEEEEHDQMLFAEIANRNAEAIKAAKKAETRRKRLNTQELHDLKVSYLALGLLFLTVLLVGYVEAVL